MTGMVAGGLGGLGLVIVVNGLRPTRPRLVTALATLDAPASRWRNPPDSFAERLGRGAQDIAPIGRLVESRSRELALVEKRPDQLVTELLLHALVGGLVPAVFMFGAGSLVGVGGLVLPTWVAVVGCGVGVAVALAQLRSEAAQAREQYRATLIAIFDLAAVALAAGRGLESAIDLALVRVDGAPASALRREIADARRELKPIWPALRGLGERTGVDDLVELASALEAADLDGARARRALQARAGTLRIREQADAEAAANRVTEQLQLPATFLAVGVLLLLLYPAAVAMGAT